MAPVPVSQFLLLPIELRLQVYEVLWEPLTNYVHHKNSTVAPHHVAFSASGSLDLLRVCRQIYHEAHRTAFGRHTFLLTRSFGTNSPLLHLPTSYPHHLITSLLLPGYRPPSYCPTAHPVRCYTFKEICSLVRRFKNLRTILIVAAEEGLEGIRRSMAGRRAHVDQRMRKARRLSDERFVPSYDLRGLNREKDPLKMWGWRVSVAVGDGTVRSADLLLCALEASESDVAKVKYDSGYDALEDVRERNLPFVLRELS